MLKTHHNILVTMGIVEEELRKNLIVRHARETTKQGIEDLNILISLLITRSSIMMIKVYYIENHVFFVPCITM